MAMLQDKISKLYKSSQIAIMIEKREPTIIQSGQFAVCITGSCIKSQGGWSHERPTVALGANVSGMWQA